MAAALAAAAAVHGYVVPLQPAPPLATQAYHNSSMWSWGGVPIQGDDGRWHLFNAAFSAGCGLGAWTTNSFVAHGVGPGPAGPFSFAGVAVDIYAHNPQVGRAGVMSVRVPSRSPRAIVRPHCSHADAHC